MITINGRRIGRGHPAFVIAEVSANHHHDYAQAERLVREAARAGADAVKLQTYTADTMTIDSDADTFQLGAGNTWTGRTAHDLYEKRTRRGNGMRRCNRWRRKRGSRSSRRHSTRPRWIFSNR